MAEKKNYQIEKDVDLIWNPAAPVIFVDGARGLAESKDGIVRFNLFNHILKSGVKGAEMPMERQNVAQLVMTAGVARSIGAWLLEHVDAKDDAKNGSDE